MGGGGSGVGVGIPGKERTAETAGADKDQFCVIS